MYYSEGHCSTTQGHHKIWMTKNLISKFWFFSWDKRTSEIGKRIRPMACKPGWIVKSVTIAVGKLKLCCHLLVDNTKLVVHYVRPYVSRSARGFQLGTWYIRVFSLSGIQYSGSEKYHLTLESNEILLAQIFKKGNT